MNPQIANIHKDWRSLFQVQIGNFLDWKGLPNVHILFCLHITVLLICNENKEIVLPIWWYNRGLFPLRNKYLEIFVLNGLRSGTSYLMQWSHLHVKARGVHSPHDWLRTRVQKKRRKGVFFRHRRRRRFPYKRGVFFILHRTLGVPVAKMLDTLFKMTF